MVKDPAITLLSNGDGAVVTSGANWVERIVTQVAAPVRWDLCMETMSDIGVTALIELVPGGTLAGLAKRALPGVELLALKTPDQLATRPRADRGARHGHERVPGGICRALAEWRIVVAPGGGTFRSGAEEGAAAATSAGETLLSRRGARAGRDARRAAAGDRAVEAALVEWLAEDGDPVSEGQPLVRLEPKEADRQADAGARILAFGGYQPDKVVTNDDLAEARRHQ